MPFITGMLWVALGFALGTLAKRAFAVKRPDVRHRTERERACLNRACPNWFVPSMGECSMCGMPSNTPRKRRTP